MTQQQKNLRPFLDALIREIDTIKDRLPCCPNCEFWGSQVPDTCGYNSQNIKPPAEVIAFGCWAYEQKFPF